MKLETRRGKLLVIAETHEDCEIFASAFGPLDQDKIVTVVKIQGEARISHGYSDHYLAIGVQTESQRNAVRVAKRIVDDPAADPADDVVMLSRKALKQDEIIGRLEAALVAQQDPTRDLIEANRDAILSMHEKAWVRIKNCLSGQPKTDREEMVLKILDAVAQFHPMHAESFPGWPEGSKP